jgi:hypothetical protein
MKTINLFTIMFLLMMIQSNALAQFKEFLPSENEYVTGYSYDDWIVVDETEYSGKYEYVKNEWVTKVYDPFIIITNKNDNVLFEITEDIGDGTILSTNEIITMNSEGFLAGNRSGIFRKLNYKDKNGIEKISYQIRMDGDCCDGACDDYFERVEIKFNH